MTSLNCTRYHGKATFKLETLGENSGSGFGGPVAQVDEEECQPSWVKDAQKG